MADRCKDLQRTVDNIEKELVAKDNEIENWKLAGNQQVVEKLQRERSEIQRRRDDYKERLDECLTNELNR
jgi:hypothetical protein